MLFTYYTTMQIQLYFCSRHPTKSLLKPSTPIPLPISPYQPHKYPKFVINLSSHNSLRKSPSFLSLSKKITKTKALALSLALLARDYPALGINVSVDKSSSGARGASILAERERERERKRVGVLGPGNNEECEKCESARARDSESPRERRAAARVRSGFYIARWREKMPCWFRL